MTQPARTDPAGSPTAPASAVVAPWTHARPLASPLHAGDRVLVVGAHPDDETIGAGRLLADHDGPVRAVTLTAGECCYPDLDPVAMAAVRLAEWHAALAALGVEPDGGGRRWPDGRLAEHEPDLVAALVELAADADVLVTTWQHDPHPDHAAAGRAVAAAAALVGARLVEFPVWAPYWLPAEEVARLGYAVGHVDTSAGAGRSRDRGLTAYASQTGVHVAGVPPVVPAAMLERHPHQLVMSPTGRPG